MGDTTTYQDMRLTVKKRQEWGKEIEKFPNFLSESRPLPSWLYKGNPLSPIQGCKAPSFLHIPSGGFSDDIPFYCTRIPSFPSQTMQRSGDNGAHNFRFPYKSERGFLVRIQKNPFQKKNIFEPLFVLFSTAISVIILINNPLILRYGKTDFRDFQLRFAISTQYVLQKPFFLPCTEYKNNTCDVTNWTSFWIHWCRFEIGFSSPRHSLLFFVSTLSITTGIERFPSLVYF